MMNDRRFPSIPGRAARQARTPCWLPPAEVIGALAAHTGEAIADVGAGTGYFTLLFERSRRGGKGVRGRRAKRDACLAQDEAEPARIRQHRS